MPKLEEALTGKQVIHPEAQELHSLAVEQLQRVRAQASFLRSGDLVRSAVHREFLDRILKTSPVPRLEAEIMLELDRLSTLYATVAAEARIIGERYERSRRNRLEIVIQVVAALALFHFWTFLNDSFEWGETAAKIEIGLTIVVVVVLAVGVFRLLTGPSVHRKLLAWLRGGGQSRSRADI